jgi:hypothetical protein
LRVTTAQTTASPARQQNDERRAGRIRLNTTSRPRSSFQSSRTEKPSAQDEPSANVAKPPSPVQNRQRPDLNRFGGTRSRFRPSSADKEVNSNENPAAVEAKDTGKSAEVAEQGSRRPPSGRTRPSFSRPSNQGQPISGSRPRVNSFRNRQQEQALAEKTTEKADAVASADNPSDENSIAKEEEPRNLRRRPSAALANILNQRRPAGGRRPGRLFPPRRGQEAAVTQELAQDTPDKVYSETDELLTECLQVLHCSAEKKLLTPPQFAQTIYTDTYH